MLKEVVFVNGGRDKAIAALKEAGGETGEILFLADTAEGLLALQEAGAYAIGNRHEGNKDEDLSRAIYIFEDAGNVPYDSYVKAYQRCAGEPWDILETERLFLRESTVADVDVFYEIYGPPSMTRYMEGLMPDPEDEKRYMEEYIEKIYGLFGFGIYTVILKETGEIIGRAGFSVREGFDRIELGFLIGVPWQGEGYAKEALSALIDYAKKELGLNFIQAFVREENDISIGLLSSLGMKALGKDIIRGGEHLRMGMEL